MAVMCRFRGFMRRTKYIRESLNINNVTSNSLVSRSLCTYVEQPKSKGILRFSLIGAGLGAAVGVGYAFTKINDARQKLALEGSEIDVKLLKYKPDVKPSRRIISPVDSTGLKLTLFQYQTCPFCCKVRVLLDYYGISYDVVEVDPVLRREINWSDYRKVPILLAKVDKGYQPLNDSSMIVSVITSFLNDKSQKLDEIAKYYPVIAMHDEKEVFKHEIVNKYFLMYQNYIPKNRSMNDIVEERKWRKWADDVFVHTLSPNVYRTLGEAYQTFNWFSKVGHWEEYFPAWERAIMINVGALAMWLISKRLKKKHQLKDDVRQSFYDEINLWLNEIKAKRGTFMGGANPDLSDLAVYGVLKSIEGCKAFNDALNHTKLSVWYSAMKEKVDSHAGSIYLSN
ncbi:prostaglandin E synthase 2 [Phymastichus coffea]|uniref:prostaglandin E synthase 2 n=1 Tax=Phymastichus coffea TaxID=108790 RepID=UPI00273CE366|nr:prostaglandin E synthase 2 [Phymastichus coffea]